MPDATPPGLFTIGHSNLALGDFLGLLQQHGIDTVADVRTTPGPAGCRTSARDRCGRPSAECAISYVPLGRELGGRPPDAEFYDEQGHVLYGRLAATPAFREGIDRVLAGAQTRRIALLCSEEDPSRCHRHLLIGRVLRDRGVAVSHIRRDGHIDTEAELAARELPPRTLVGSGD